MKWLLSFITVFLFVWRTSGQRRCPPQELILPCRCLVRAEEYQIWCTHSDLPRILESLKSISKQITDPIDQMILQNNYLPSLPGRAFSPLKILRLMLRHNGLQRVSTDWLAGLERSLVEIFLVESELRSLPDDCLSNLDVLQAVTVQTRLMKRLPSFSGLPNLKYVHVDSESLLEISPGNFKRNPNLEDVHVKSSLRLTRLEANLFMDLPKLNLVNVTDCGLSWMHPRVLVGLPEMKELSLVGNKIVDVAMVGRSSRDIQSLEVVNLDHNYVDHIGEGSFVDLPTLKSLSLSNNRITHLQRGAFHRVPSLKSLNLNKNFIKHVHPESFTGEGLEELLMEENDITDITELGFILEGLPKLTFLDLSVNRLEAVPFGALGRGHPSLEHLNLGYNKIHLVDKEAFMAMPALRELRLRNNSLSDLSEPPFWNLPALKGLDLSYNLFRRPNPRLLDNLPSLRRIDLSGNGMDLIDPTVFLPTLSLEHVNLSHNNLNFLHPVTFRPLQHLYELDVSYNELKEIVPGLPRGTEYLRLRRNLIGRIPVAPSTDLDLPKLRALDLRENLIEVIPKEAFGTLMQLRRLSLGSNMLRAVDLSSFEGLSKLETLDLSNNKLVEIKPNTLSKMPELREVDLRDNRLDVLSQDLFRTSTKLTRLDLSKNRIADLPTQILQDNLDLEEFDASNNILKRFPETLKELKKLRKIDLTNNRIEHIQPQILDGLSNIRTFKLSHNLIKEMKEGTFNGMQHLKLLDLDDNELVYLESNAMKDLPKLRAVRLSRNMIRELPGSVFNGLQSLQSLHLQENEITDIAPDAFKQIPHLLTLNLSHNHLTNLESANLQSLNSLEVLDLSHNKITRLVTSSLDTMEWLVELRMDHNEICTVIGTGFNNMPRLRVISLRNNKLLSFPEKSVQRLRGNIGVLDINGNPLVCACTLLWYQAWVQESGQEGPRCSDETLLRDVLLSRDSCTEEERNRDVTSPGCDSELLLTSGVQHQGTKMEKWTKLKDMDKGKIGAVQVQPLPEESEYFYDDYVDYPAYNESVAVTGEDKYTSREPAVIEKVIPMNKTTGNTPTLYAAPKNKTKQIPTKITDSPSSSGFTFFGVPLSNLNLNNLFAGGTSTKKPPHSAQRKTAIVNEPKINRDYYNKMDQNLRPPHSPELQGGFVPILPGSGGFKPIPDPNLMDVRKSDGGTKEYITKLLPSKGGKVYNNSVTVRNVTSEVFNVEKQTHSIAELKTFNETTGSSTSSTTTTTTTSTSTISLPKSTTTTTSTTTTETPPSPTSTFPPPPLPPSSNSSKLRTEPTHPKLEPFPLLAPDPDPSKYMTRSTVTKVSSPHLQVEAPQAQRVAKNTDVVIVEEPEDGDLMGNVSDTHWYFANYNKTDLEPFVAKVYDSKGCRREGGEVVLLVQICLLLNVYYLM